MKLMELVEGAPWREAVTYRDTWPHEYVLTCRDDCADLLALIVERWKAGEGVKGRFSRMENTYLLIVDYKYWIMTPYEEFDVEEAKVDDYVLNRARLYRDRRDFVVQSGDTGKPEDVDELVLDLYRRLPEVRITDILLEVDAATGFTDAFTHLRTGALCQDRIGLLNVLLAEGLNLGLSKMAEASNTHDFFQLSRLSRWHIESEAIDRALAMVIEAQAQLPMASHWGLGLTASSDGQFFPAARQGEAMNLVNARYGSEPGPQGLYPCLGPVRTLRNANNPGHGQRSALHSRRVADDQGRASHP